MAIDKKYLLKFDRFCSWLLIAIMAAFFITGYGETKAIIPAQLAKFIHETILPVPGAVAFAFHSAYGMHIAFKRWRWWGRTPLIILVLYAVIMVIGAVIFEYAVEIPGNVSVPQSINL